MFHDHARSFDDNWYVYPVISRRAGGLSIGVNLSRDKRCNFDCVYCQVDRRGAVHGDCPDRRGAKMCNEGDSPIFASPLRVLSRKLGQSPPQSQPIDFARLEAELCEAIDLATSGAMFHLPRFSRVPEPLRRLNDIALSGDGEPTACPEFAEVAQRLAAIHETSKLDVVKLVVITNATLLHLERVEQGLKALDPHQGEVWAKLDAGTEAYYQRVARSRVPFSRILGNLLLTSTRRSIVVQTLWMRLEGVAPPAEEIEAYCARLQSITSQGGKIRLVQLHTVARPPAESSVAPLAADELNELAERVRRATQLSVAVFPAA